MAGDGVKLEVVGVGLSQAERRFGSISATWRSLAGPRVAVHAGAIVLRAALKAAAPSRTGALRASIGFRTVGLAGGLAAQFYANQTAVFVIGGTRAHDIWAGIYTGRSDKRVLAWPGMAHPTPYVHHPGTRPNDFRRTAWTEAREPVRAILRTTGRAILTGGLVG